MMEPRLIHCQFPAPTRGSHMAVSEEWRKHWSPSVLGLHEILLTRFELRAHGDD